MNKISIFSGVLLASISSVCASSQQKPNIIFILCDDMGYGDLGCYGQKYISTPNIDRMAQEGMSFTQAYAGSPVSAPSRATIMTGQHSGHSHVRGNKEYWINVPLMKYGANDEYTVVGQEPYDPSHIILPEIMKKTGILQECLANGPVVMKVLALRQTSVVLMSTTGLSVSFRLTSIIQTFCELIGDRRFPKKYINKKLKGDCFDGVSFASTLLGDDTSQKKHDYLYWEFHETDQMAVRMGDWKLVVKKGVSYLYNLADDIHEDNDISTNHPEIVKQMIEIIKKEHKESDFFKVTLPL